MCSPSIRTSPSPASSSGMLAADPAARATSTGDTLGVVPKARLVSLDVFRGLTVAAILLGLGRRLETGEGRGPIVTRIVRRAVIIFALGLILHAVSNFDPATIRI